MTAYRDQLALDISNILSEGFVDVAATYDSHDGSIAGKSVKIGIDRKDRLQPTGSGAAEAATITVEGADIPAPTIYDTLTETETGQEWMIMRRTGGNGVFWLLECYSDRRGNPRS